MIGFFVFLMGIVLVILTLAGGLRWIDVRGRAVGSGPAAPVLERLEDALGRLEGRVDALEDQQRFLERLLAERPEPGRLPPPEERSILFDLGPAEDGEDV